MYDLKRQPNEILDEAYIWRIGTAKDSGQIDYTWKDLAPIISAECCEEKAEGVWRQHYAAGKRWKAFFDTLEATEDADLLRERTQELVKERMKLRDERTALNKELRNHARYEMNNEVWERKLAELGRLKFPVVETPHFDGDRSLLICLSDWHIGMAFDSHTGSYNTDIARHRLSHLLCEIRDIQQRHKADCACVAVLGDLISGAPHSVIALENREDVIEQVILTGELMASFIYELSKMFVTVEVQSVNGNHSRITPNKKDAVLGERLDALVMWHDATESKHVPNVTVNKPAKLFGGTLDIMEIQGRSYVLGHGDFDKFTEAGIAKLVTYLGAMPSAIVLAHKHTAAYMEVGDMVCVQNGCLSGGGDQFTLEHRLGGRASQTVCVCSDRGIESMYPIKLS